MPERPPGLDLRTKEGRAWKKAFEERLMEPRDLDVPHRELPGGVSKPDAPVHVMEIYQAACGHWVPEGGSAREFVVSRSSRGNVAGMTVFLCRTCARRVADDYDHWVSRNR